MDTIIPKDQFMMIYWASYCSLGSSLYAIYRSHYHLCIVPASVFLSSIHYWKKPDYSYRRYLDMAVVQTALAYQVWNVWEAENFLWYMMMTSIGSGWFLYGVYNYSIGNTWRSTYAHILLHIFANIGNIILYSGRV